MLIVSALFSFLIFEELENPSILVGLVFILERGGGFGSADRRVLSAIAAEAFVLFLDKKNQDRIISLRLYLL